MSRQALEFSSPMPLRGMLEAGRNFEELHFWDDIGVPDEEKQTSPHTQGTSAVQFILTSSIVIHTLDQLEAVYINIFSCKFYDPKVAEKFSVKWFSAKDHSARFIDRV